MAKICIQCGFRFNPDQGRRCVACGADLPTETNDIDLCVVCGHAHETADAVTAAGQEAFTETTPIRCEPDGNLRGRGMIDGRITHLECRDERPPSDWCTSLTRILLTILLIVPYIVLFILTGILSFVFAVLRFQSLSHLFNPVFWTTALVEMMELVVLHGLRRTDTVPVYRGTLQEGCGQQHFFMIVGSLNAGTLTPGMEVRFTGRWYRGTLRVRSGIDLHTGAAISSGFRNRSRIYCCVIVAFYIALGSGFYFYLG